MVTDGLTCSVTQSMASMTSATTSAERMARKARFTDRASARLSALATEARRRMPAVSLREYSCSSNTGTALSSCQRALLP